MKTNTQKHTPGPWVLLHNNSDHCFDLKGSNGNTLIAQFPFLEPIDGTAYRPGDEDAGNCRLMAAAPELLEALGDLLRYCDDPPRFNEVMTQVKDNARAAIAKATGGDQ